MGGSEQKYHTGCQSIVLHISGLPFTQKHDPENLSISIGTQTIGHFRYYQPFLLMFLFVGSLHLQQKKKN